MTREQIKILIGDYDIWPVSSFHSAMSDCTFIDINQNIEYFISFEMYKIFEQVFDKCLKFEVDFEHRQFKETVINKLKLISPLKEHKIAFYNDLIKELNNVLETELDQIYNVSLPTISFAISIWPIFLLKNGMELIECLKFKVLDGGKLESFSFGTIEKKRSKDYKLIENYFFSSTMKKLYFVVTIGENIKYLQNCIAAIDESKNVNTIKQPKNQATHRDNAIAYIFKQKADLSKFKELSRKEAREFRDDKGIIAGKNFEIALGLLTYFGKKINTKTTYKPYTKKDLERVLHLGLLKNHASALTNINEELARLTAK